MAGDLYLVFLTIIMSYSIFRYVCLFKKGEYNPYPYRKQKEDLPFIIRFCINLGIIIGGAVFLTNIKFLSIGVVIFIVYSICLIVCVSVLNYLSYIRIKDKKIIVQTAIFDLMIIIMSTGIWKYISGVV